MPNPFYCCNRIPSPEMFIGRKPLLRRIFTALDTTHTQQLQSVSVVGERRMGRSSLLYHLTHTYHQHLPHPERYLFLYLELHSGQFNTQAGLLCGILAHLARAVPPAHHTLVRNLKRASRDPDMTLEAFESAVKQCHILPPAPLYPVLCLDEFEQLSKHPQQFPRQLFDSWRSLINDGQVAFVITSSRPLFELVEEERLTSPFFNIFAEYLTLDRFTEAEAYTLAERGRKCDHPFTDADIQRMLAWGDRHPLKLQQAGKAIYQAKAQPAPNWRQVKRTYQAAIRQQMGQRTRWQQLTRFCQHLPGNIGRLALFWKGDAAGDEQTRQVVGWAILLGIPLLGLLLLVWPELRPLFMPQLYTPTPTPIP